MSIMFGVLLYSTVGNDELSLSLKETKVTLTKKDGAMTAQSQQQKEIMNEVVARGSRPVTEKGDKLCEKEMMRKESSLADVYSTS